MKHGTGSESMYLHREKCLNENYEQWTPLKVVEVTGHMRDEEGGRFHYTSFYTLKKKFFF